MYDLAEGAEGEGLTETTMQIPPDYLQTKSQSHTDM